MLAALSVLTVIILSALNAYRSGVRFIGEQDYINIALGVGLGYAAALLVVGMGLAFEFAGFSPGFFILGPVLTSVVLISLRFGGKRLVRLLIGARRDLTPALVFGETPRPLRWRARRERASHGCHWLARTRESRRCGASRGSTSMASSTCRACCVSTRA